MNRKALVTDMAKWIGNILLIIVVTTFIFFVYLTFAKEVPETHNLESFTISRSLIYSQNCLALDSENQALSGVIDINKMTSERLAACYSKDGVGYTVKLSDLQGQEIKFVNPGFRLNNYFTVCQDSPYYECSANQYYVLYKSDNKIIPGILSIGVITLV